MSSCPSDHVRALGATAAENRTTGANDHYNNERHLADVVEPPVIADGTDHVKSTEGFSCAGPHLLLQVPTTHTDVTIRHMCAINNYCHGVSHILLVFI